MTCSITIKNNGPEIYKVEIRHTRIYQKQNLETAPAEATETLSMGSEVTLNIWEGRGLSITELKDSPCAQGL